MKGKPAMHSSYPVIACHPDPGRRNTGNGVLSCDNC